MYIGGKKYSNWDFMNYFKKIYFFIYPIFLILFSFLIFIPLTNDSLSFFILAVIIYSFSILMISIFTKGIKIQPYHSLLFLIYLNFQVIVNFIFLKYLFFKDGDLIHAISFGFFQKNVSSWVLFLLIFFSVIICLLFISIAYKSLKVSEYLYNNHSEKLEKDHLDVNTLLTQGILSEKDAIFNREKLNFEALYSGNIVGITNILLLSFKIIICLSFMIFIFGVIFDENILNNLRINIKTVILHLQITTFNFLLFAIPLLLVSIAHGNLLNKKIRDEYYLKYFF